MMLKQISWMHENLPYPLLKAWSLCDKSAAMTRRLAFGNGSQMKYERLLAEMERWPLHKIREWQYSRLKRMLEHAYKNVPFYRKAWNKAGVNPSKIKCMEDLRKLPIISKEEVIANGADFFSQTVSLGNVTYRATSGTSGQSVKFYIDGEVLSSMWATYRHFSKSFGVLLGEDVTLHSPLLIPPIHLLRKDKLAFGRFSPLTRDIVFSSKDMDDETFQLYLRYIKRFDIKYIEGLPSLVYAFCLYLRDIGKRIRVKAAVLNGEMLFEHQRELIEKMLGCEVFNRYGSCESTVVAYECQRHDGMHISPFGVVEAMDNGKGYGEVVTTNLVNYSYPLIRYALRDMVSLSDKPCKCGSGFPRIMKIEGRANDFITLPDGSQIHPSPLAWFPVAIPEIKDIYFLQNEDYTIDILVVRAKEIDPDKIIRSIRKRMDWLCRRKREKPRYKVTFCKEIKRRSYKYKVVESKIKG